MGKVFLASYENGIQRAELQPDGNWSVESKIPELKVTCLAQDPNDLDTIYAGTRETGVWRSEDRGSSWQELGLKGPVVKSLAISAQPEKNGPQIGKTLYAGTKPGRLFSSQDGGKSWWELTSFRKVPNRWWWFSPAEPPDWRPYISAIAPSPTDPEVIVAGIEFGAVVRSEDGGSTWSRHLRGALRDCHVLKFHTTNGDWVYEAGAGLGAGASYSQDSGRSWQKTSKGMAKKYGIVCAADPIDPETWYACVASGPGKAFGNKPQSFLYRTRDSRSWEPIGWEVHPLSETPTALVTMPGAAGQLYAGLKNGEIWHTVDYGDTWEKMPFKLNGIWFSMVVLQD